MTSQQSGSDLDIGLSHSHQRPPQIYHHHHYFHHQQQHIPGHPMIFPVITIDDESIRDQGCFEDNWRILKAEARNPSPDYDNLVPVLKLERIVEEERGGDIVSINDVCCGISTASTSIADREDVLVGSSEGGTKDGSRGGYHFPRVYKGEDTNRNYFSPISSVCDSNDTNAVSAVKSEDVIKEMGNGLFSSRAVSVSDTRAASNIVNLNNNTLDLVGCTQKKQLDFSSDNCDSSVQFHDKNYDSSFAESSTVSNIQKETGRVTHETFESIKPVYHSETFSTSTSCSSVTKTENKEKEKSDSVFLEPSGSDTYDNLDVQFSENESGCTSDAFSPAPHTGQDNHKSQITANMTQSAGSDHLDYRSHRSEPTVTIQCDMHKSDTNASMTTANTSYVSLVETPKILITPSTPMKTPSQSSPNTILTISDSGTHDETYTKSSVQNVTEVSVSEKENAIAVSEAPSIEKHKELGEQASSSVPVEGAHKSAVGMKIQYGHVVNKDPSDVSCNFCKNNSTSEQVFGYGVCSHEEHSVTNASFVRCNQVTTDVKATKIQSSTSPPTSPTEFAVVQTGKTLICMRSDDTTTSFQTKDLSLQSSTYEFSEVPIECTDMNPRRGDNNENYSVPSHTVGKSTFLSQDAKTAVETISAKTTAENISAKITEDTVTTTKITNVSNYKVLNEVLPAAEVDKSLIDEDTDSLLGSHYTAIPVLKKERVNAVDSRGTTSSSDIKRLERAGKVDIKTNIKDDSDDEAIYAIPVPKSQRNISSANSKVSHKKLQLRSKKVLAGAELPPAPPRAAVSSGATHQRTNIGDATKEHVSRTNVEVTCQIKKSTTTKTIHPLLDENEYDYANIPKHGRYNFFSLGRHPKLFRTRTLRDSRGVAVSLDMLLRYRRQSSSSDISSVASEDQTLSVEDIIKSCDEFEQNNSSYRARTCSDSTHTSSLYSMPFIGVSKMKSTFYSIQETENYHTDTESQASKSFLKKSNSDITEIRPIVKINQDRVASGAILASKINDFNNTESKEKYGSLESDVRLPSKLCEAGNGPQRLPATSSGDKNFTKDEMDRLEHKQKSKFSKIKSPTSVKTSYTTERASEFELLQGNHEPKSDKSEVKDIDFKKNLNIHSSVRSDSSNHSASLKHNNSDYDILEHSQSSQVLHEESELLTPKTEGNSSPSAMMSSNTKANKVPHPAWASDSPALSYPHSGKALRRCNGSENFVHEKTVQSNEKFITLKEVESQPMPQITPVVSGDTKQATASLDNHTKSNSKHTIKSLTFIEGSASSFSDPTISSSLFAASPITPISLCTDPTTDSSPGVFSPSSVDIFEDLPLDDSPVATTKAPNYFAKLEAVEALKWLRAAGFPQYAQMFDDGQFPVDMCMIEKDHDFLDQDSLQSLFRRLETLNKHAGTPLGSLTRKQGTSDEDEEEYLCALSDRWEYEKSARRWSRKDVTSSPTQQGGMGSDQREASARSVSNDILLNQRTGHPTPDQSSSSLMFKVPNEVDLHHAGFDRKTISPRNLHVTEIPMKSQDLNCDTISPNLNPVTSEKGKTSNNVFKTVDVSKSKNLRKSKRRNIGEISGPIMEDSEYLRAKLERLNCVDISHKSETSFNASLTGAKPSKKSFGSSSKGTKKRHNSREISKSHTSPLCSTPIKSPPHSTSSPNESSFPSVIPLSSSYHSGNTSTTNRSTEIQESILQNNSIDNRNSNKNVQPTQKIHVAMTTNKDTNRKEVFQISKNHPPGQFPGMLQKRSNETQSKTMGRTSKALRHDARDMVEYKGGSFLTSSPKESRTSHRESVYDNILSADGGNVEEAPRMIFPGIYQIADRETDTISKNETGDMAKINARKNVEGFKYILKNDINERYTTYKSNIGFIASPSEGTWDQEHDCSSRERTVSFESSSSSQTPVGSTHGSDAGISNSASSRSSSDSFPTNGKDLYLSSSVDSYFRGSDGRTDELSIDSRDGESSGTMQKEYDNFDQVLQQLYQNINELSEYMDREKQDSSSPHDPADSLRLYALDLYHENSFSAGEGSNTAESSNEDQELPLTDQSHDDSLDLFPKTFRERRDSGVGHSLPRAPNERKQKKIRWHSFQKSHRPDITCRAMQINSLTVSQMVRLQKLCLLKLTGIMEKCLPMSRSGWNWAMPRFMKRNKMPAGGDQKVFGVSFSAMAQRTGQPLPQCVLYAMRYLRRTSPSAVGIFRKSGVKSKIQQLREELEARPDTIHFDEFNAYNVADMLKTYFRDLPECLLTNKMSEIFKSIFMHVPPPQRLEALQAAIVLLPDENREVLQSMLLFLSDVSSHDADHQMNASNLAVCFTPTLFQSGPRHILHQSIKKANKMAPAITDPREMLEQKAANECLVTMITECKKLFTVLPNLYQQLQVPSLAQMMPGPLLDIDSSPSDVRAFGQERIQVVLKEAHDKNRGWLHSMTVGDVEVFHRKPMDNCPLKEWKLIVELEAPPIEALHRIMHERHAWDEDLLSWSVVKRMDPHSDIFQFVLNSMAPHPFRYFCVLRYWRSDLTKGACALVTMSVEPTEDLEVPGVCAVDLGSYFLMEPCGSGRSRLTYVTRVDTRGRTPEWYTRIFGHISASFLERLKESFKHVTSGPETRL